jgi:hypothetical protein
MTDHEKLIRDIEGLKSSIRLNFADLAKLDLSLEARDGMMWNGLRQRSSCNHPARVLAAAPRSEFALQPP